MRESTYWARIDVPRNAWDPTEQPHDRHGERTFADIGRLEVHWPGIDDIADHGDSPEELLSFERHHEVSKGWYDLFYNVGLDTEGNSYEGRDATIKSQAGLESVLSMVVMVDVDGGLRVGEFDLLAARVWQWWGAVDPERKRGSLGYHSQRATSACPGDVVRSIVHTLWAGWIPPAAYETRGGPLFATVHEGPNGYTKIHTGDGSAVVSEPKHWFEVIEAGRVTGVYRSPFFDQLDALVWAQAAALDPPDPLSDADVARIAAATAAAVPGGATPEQIAEAVIAEIAS